MIRVYPITPCPAPRQVRADAWDPTPSVQRYRAFRDECRIRHVQLPRPFHHVIFVLPMPTSWSKKQRTTMEGMPHEQKPDRDNMEKALLDSVYGEDCQVWDGRASKLWGTQGLIIVSRDQIDLSTLPLRMEPYYQMAALPRHAQQSRDMQDAPSP